MIHYFMTECKTWRRSARGFRSMSRLGANPTFLNVVIVSHRLDEEQIHTHTVHIHHDVWANEQHVHVSS